MTGYDYTLVAVQWLDACTGHTSWTPASDVVGEFGVCFSSGFLIHEDEDRLVLAQSLNCWAGGEGEPDAGDTITIPTVLVQHRWDVTLAPDGDEEAV